MRSESSAAGDAVERTRWAATWEEVRRLAGLLLDRLPHARARLAFIVGGSVINLCAVTWSPLLNGKILDALTMGGLPGFVRWLCVLLGVMALQVVLTVSVGYASTVSEAEIGRRLRADVACALLSVERGSNASVADATARVMSDVQRVQAAFSGVFLQPTLDVVSLGLATFFTLRASPLTGALALVAAPCAIYCNRRLTRRLERNSHNAQVALGRMVEGVQAWLGRAPWVRVYGIVSTARARISGRSADLYALTEESAKLRAQLGVAGVILTLSPQVLILALGGWEVLHAQATVGSLVALLGLSSLLTAPLNRLVQFASVTMSQLRPSCQRVMDALAREVVESSPESPAARVELLDLLGVRVGVRALEARGVSVWTSHFCARRNEIVGVLGPNGSGKTTLISALVGLCPSSGVIEIETDGQRRALRPSDVAFAPAEPVLFDGSVVDNVSLYGELSWCDPETLKWASVGDRGEHGERSALELGLSRGELQKIALARALCMRRPILVLDEPSIGLDVQALRELVVQLRAASQRGPVIVVSHDEQLLASVDRAYMMTNAGPQWELLELEPAGAQFWGARFVRRPGAAVGAN